MAVAHFYMNNEQSDLLNRRKNRKFIMRCLKEYAYEQLESIYSVDQLSSFVRKHGFCDICDFSGLNISAARTIVNCVIAVIYKYPYLRGTMCYVGSKNGYVAMLKKFTRYDPQTLKLLGVQHICDNAMAQSIGQTLLELISEQTESATNNVLAQAISGMGLVDGILLDENDFSTTRFLQIKKNLLECEKSGFYPRGCNSVSSVIYHELGHMVDFLCRASEDDELVMQYKSSTKHEIGNKLSEYAATSVREYVAEGFSEYMSSSAPRTTAKFVVGVMDKCYQSLTARK